MYVNIYAYLYIIYTIYIIYIHIYIYYIYTYIYYILKLYIKTEKNNYKII